MNMTGCEKCDEIQAKAEFPNVEMCLDCRIAEKDARIVQLMNEVAELRKEKAKLKEKQNEISK